MKNNVKRLLAIGVLFASSQAIALPTFYNTSINHEYELNFISGTGSASIAENSNQRRLSSDGYVYGSDEYAIGEIQTDSRAEVEDSSISMAAIVYDRRVDGDTQIDFTTVTNSFPDFSASVSVSGMFDVIGGPIDILYEALSLGTQAEYSFNIERSINGEGVDSIVNLSNEPIPEIGLPIFGRYTLSEGTYRIFSSIDVLQTNEDPAFFDVAFQNAPVGVPEPYTPLLLLMSLLMIIRSKKASK